MKKTFLVVIICLVVIFFQFCSKKDSSVPNNPTGNTDTVPTLPASPFNYVVNYPAHIQSALLANDNTPADNPITNDGATLGRVLFFDKKLSINRTVSCGTCHNPKLSFDDTLVLSKGFNGQLTARNSQPVLNLRFYKSGKMFWDERAASVEKQALVPIQSTVEMGMTLSELESRVRSLSYYPPLFQKAFGSPAIDSIKIAKAIAQFERSIVTYQSKYDRVKEGLESFTAQEAAGEQFFNTPPPPPPGGGPALSCNSCHAAPMFMRSDAPPFGLRDVNDLGINNTGNFKQGTLRNIGISRNLFHNGSVPNLLAMLVAGTPGNGPPIPAHSIPAANVQNVIAFLNTLTDNTVLTEEKFSNPFK